MCFITSLQSHFTFLQFSIQLERRCSLSHNKSQSFCLNLYLFLYFHLQNWVVQKGSRRGSKFCWHPHHQTSITEHKTKLSGFLGQEQNRILHPYRFISCQQIPMFNKQFMMRKPNEEFLAHSRQVWWSRELGGEEGTCMFRWVGGWRHKQNFMITLCKSLFFENYTGYLKDFFVHCTVFILSWSIPIQKQQLTVCTLFHI